MNVGAAFGSRDLTALAVVCGVSLLVGLVIGALGTDLAGHRSAGADSFSRSALGHRALVELLRELDVPVSRRLTMEHAFDGSLVVVAEPRLHESGDADDAWRSTLDRAKDFLVVLPKRTGISDPKRPAHVGITWLLETGEIQGTLDRMEIDAHVVRPRTEPDSWRGLPSGLAPPAVDDLQLLEPDGLRPLWSCELGVLAAWCPIGPKVAKTRKRLVVLSDPDLMANHGLTRDDNAAYMLELITLLGGLDNGVTIDESVHGFSANRSIWREFFRFPLSLVAIQLLLTGVALAWMATRRFGAVEPLPAPHGSGQAYLIENTAGLLRQGGHGAHILRSYLDAAVAGVTRDLRLDRRLTREQARRRLLRIGHVRDVNPNLEQVEALIELTAAERVPRESRILAAAGVVQRWRHEMTRT